MTNRKNSGARRAEHKTGSTQARTMHRTHTRTNRHTRTHCCFRTTHRVRYSIELRVQFELAKKANQTKLEYESIITKMLHLGLIHILISYRTLEQLTTRHDCGTRSPKNQFLHVIDHNNQYLCKKLSDNHKLLPHQTKCYKPDLTSNNACALKLP